MSPSETNKSHKDENKALTPAKAWQLDRKNTGCEAGRPQEAVLGVQRGDDRRSEHVMAVEMEKENRLQRC